MEDTPQIMDQQKPKQREGLEHHYHQFKQYALKKYSNLDELVPAYEDAASKILESPLDSVITKDNVFESIVSLVSEKLTEENNKIKAHKSLLMFMLTVALAKMWIKLEGTEPENFQSMLNDWGQNLELSELNPKQRRNVIKTMEDVTKPLYNVVVTAKGLNFVKESDLNNNQIFTEKLDKMIDLHDKLNLDEHEQWVTKHQLQKCLNSLVDKDGSADRKVALALKRSAGALPVIASLDLNKSKHSEEAMVSAITNLFESHPAPSKGYSLDAISDI